MKGGRIDFFCLGMRIWEILINDYSIKIFIVKILQFVKRLKNFKNELEYFKKLIFRQPFSIQ